ncbi:hypothetical protein OXYTRIMIC_614 [Oxytricha trifallax]|uniref:Uncharacterized protein n=1 Tax=Oxytricha trifallax TaxID=1172189 RepID=A0A073I106_9SPIT|nr:hypothetical protein OXYTRIMIC_614 [Oxytricha trifallax]
MQRDQDIVLNKHGNINSPYPLTISIEEIKEEQELNEIIKALYEVETRGTINKNSLQNTNGWSPVQFISSKLVKMKIKLKLHFNLNSFKTVAEIDQEIKDAIQNLDTSRAIELLKNATQGTKQQVFRIILSDFQIITQRKAVLFAI